MRIFRLFTLLLAFWLLPFSLSAANYVFVFYGSSSTVGIFDADTLASRGTANVTGIASKAFGVPDPASPTQFLKFYVVTHNSIVVLDPQNFSVRKTLPLTGNLAQAPGSL